MTQIRRNWTALGAVLTGVAILASPALPGAQQPTFRASVDVIAVDVTAVDAGGHPVVGLTPDQFEVRLDGHKRKVVSANFVDFRQTSTDVASGGAVEAEPPAQIEDDASGEGSTNGRVFMVVIDCRSFYPDDAVHVVKAARDFVNRLPPNDMVGVFAYPLGPKLDPTLSHAAIARAIEGVTGQRGIRNTGEFNLRGAEIVNLSFWTRGEPNSSAQRIVDSLCAPSDGPCLERLRIEADADAFELEAQASSSMETVRSMVQSFGGVPGRKTVVFVSAGLVVSDTVGGHPDLGELGVDIGEAAAKANVTVYTLFIDANMLDRTTAESRRGAGPTSNPSRDTAINERWLDQFTGQAGGELIRVLSDSGETALNQILTETSAYYLLGVEPDQADRNGKNHRVTVKVNRRGVRVMSREWAFVPKVGDTEAAAAAPPPPAFNAAAVAPALPARVVSPAIEPLVAAFERGDDAGLRTSVEIAGNPAQIMRDVVAAAPWPEAPRRQPVFALEAAAAALLGRDDSAKTEAAKLLAHENAVVRQPGGADAIECGWYRAELFLLQGLNQPNLSAPLSTVALQRCPTDARLLLAHAIVDDQRWPQDLRGMPAVPVDTSTPTADQAEALVARYEAAAKLPDTAIEARVREAWLLCRLGRFADALRLVNDPTTPDADGNVRYYYQLVRGQTLRAIGQDDGAIAAFRAALAISPGAESARVALMTLQVVGGERQGAQAMAEAVQAAPANAVDPWWFYWQGDYSRFQSELTKLRDLTR